MACGTASKLQRGAIDDIVLGDVEQKLVSNMVKGKQIGRGRMAEVFVWDDGVDHPPRVLKLFNHGVTKDVAQRELKGAYAAWQAGIPSPKPYDEIVEIENRFGITFDRAVGPTLLDSIRSTPKKLAQYAQILAQLHHAMHQTPAGDLPSGLPKLEDKLQSAISNNPDLSGAQKSQLMALLQSLPKSEHLCHGDLHPDNIIDRSQADGGPVIIDWVDSSIGSPLADVARTKILLNFGWRGLPGFNLMPMLATKLLDFIYTRHYLGLSNASLVHIKSWMIIAAAARLREVTGSEHVHLLRYVKKHLKKV